MNAQEFRKKYHATTHNHNCLKDIGCPLCGSRSPFLIAATSSFTMHDDGASEFGDLEYESATPTACRSCGNTGTLADFFIPGLDS
jgi:hypothetical protein